MPPLRLSRGVDDTEWLADPLTVRSPLTFVVTARATAGATASAILGATAAAAASATDATPFVAILTSVLLGTVDLGAGRRKRGRGGALAYEGTRIRRRLRLSKAHAPALAEVF